MYIPYQEKEVHAKKLKLGLEKLGPDFTAILCWWCEGTTIHKFEHCNVCGKNMAYASNNGLLWPGSVPAPDSVAYQVLNKADDND